MTLDHIITASIAAATFILAVGIVAIAASLYRKRNADYDGMEFEEPPIRSFLRDGEIITMATISYCRFRNTLFDLRDCYDNMNEECSEEEDRARLQIIKLAQKIVDDFGRQLDDQPPKQHPIWRDEP